MSKHDDEKMLQLLELYKEQLADARSFLLPAERLLKRGLHGVTKITNEFIERHKREFLPPGIDVEFTDCSSSGCVTEKWEGCYFLCFWYMDLKSDVRCNGDIPMSGPIRRAIARYCKWLTVKTGMPFRIYSRKSAAKMPVE